MCFIILLIHQQFFSYISGTEKRYRSQCQKSMIFPNFQTKKFPTDLQKKKDHWHRNFFYSETLYKLTKMFISGFYVTKSKVPMQCTLSHNSKYYRKQLKKDTTSRKINTQFRKLSPIMRKFTIDTKYGSLNLWRYFFLIEWVTVPVPMGRKKKLYTFTNIWTFYYFKIIIKIKLFGTSEFFCHL